MHELVYELIVIIFPLLTEKKSQRRLSQLNRDSLTTQLIQTYATEFYLGVKHRIRERTGVGHALTPPPLSFPSTDPPICYRTRVTPCRLYAWRNTAKVPSVRGGLVHHHQLSCRVFHPYSAGEATILDDATLDAALQYLYHIKRMPPPLHIFPLLLIHDGSCAAVIGRDVID